MDRVRNVCSRVRIMWHDFKRRIWNSDPDSDCFRLVDVFLLVGGILYEPKTNLQSFMWTSYRFYTYFIYMVQVMHAVENTFVENNVVATSWCVMALLMVVIALLNENIIQRSAPMIGSVRKFIYERIDKSSDSRYDLKARTTFIRTSRIVSLGVLALVIMDEMLIPLILVLHEDRIFGIPSILCFSNKFLRGALHLTYLVTVLPIWLFKVFIPIVLTTLLYTGVHCELNIFTKEFEEVCDRARKHILDQPESLFWKELTDEVKMHLAKHASYLE